MRVISVAAILVLAAIVVSTVPPSPKKPEKPREHGKNSTVCYGKTEGHDLVNLDLAGLIGLLGNLKEGLNLGKATKGLLLAALCQVLDPKLVRHLSQTHLIKLLIDLVDNIVNCVFTIIFGLLSELKKVVAGLDLKDVNGLVSNILKTNVSLLFLVLNLAGVKDLLKGVIGGKKGSGGLLGL